MSIHLKNVGNQMKRENLKRNKQNNSSKQTQEEIENSQRKPEKSYNHHEFNQQNKTKLFK